MRKIRFVRINVVTCCTDLSILLLGIIFGTGCPVHVWIGITCLRPNVASRPTHVWMTENNRDT